MLTNTTITSLRDLGCSGMADALVEQSSAASYAELSFEERLGLLVDRELSDRASRKLATRLRTAKLRQDASIEDIDFRSSRGLQRSRVLSLASSSAWVDQHQNLLITGSTGVGKSYLACAFAHAAIRHGHSAFYRRAPRLFQDLAIARADGRYARVLSQLSRVDVLCIDDFGLATFAANEPLDLLEILEDRCDARSTIMTSQLPVDAWHQLFADPTLGDAILDRITHNAHAFALTGDSLRKRTSKKEEDMA